MPFANRTEAGQRLAAHLKEQAQHYDLVIGLDKNGVMVGQQVAQALGLPLDVLITRKLVYQEEDLGAVGPNGVRIIFKDVIEFLNVLPDELDRLTGTALSQIDRQLGRFRSEKPMPQIEGRSILIVTDGMNTGLSALAAARSLRKLKPALLVVATPVSSPEAVEMLKTEVDEVITLEIPEDFDTVEKAYRQYGPIDDQEVMTILNIFPVEQSKK